MISDDDFDDPPLITRQSSQRLICREESSKTMLSLIKKSRSRVDSIKSEDFSKHRLPFLQASLFASAIEDVLAQLRILAECNNELRIYKTTKELDALRGEKFGVDPPKISDEFAGIDRKDLASEHHKLNKLVEDRKFCTKVLTDTYLELALKLSFEKLVEAVTTVNNRTEHYEFLIEEEARNKLNRRELVKQVRQQRNRVRSVLYDTNLAIETLKNEVEDASLNKEVRDRYVEKWENAREEQHVKRIEEMESGSSEAITVYRKRLDAEQRVHYEQDLHTNILINEILKQLEVWMDKYDDDTSNIDFKIQLKKLDANNQMEKRKDMEEKLEQHQSEINNWLQFKDEREKSLQYHNKMMHAGHVVQAWWRGLLVRLEIGPYKPKKKPPPQPDKKKKK